MGDIGPASTLKVQILLKSISVSIMSKFVNFMIAIMILWQFKGKSTVKRTVNMII